MRTPTHTRSVLCGVARFGMAQRLLGAFRVCRRSELDKFANIMEEIGGAAQAVDDNEEADRAAAEAARLDREKVEQGFVACGCPLLLLGWRVV